VIKNTEVRKAIVLQESELLICSTIVHEKLWTVLTTRRIFSYEGFGVMQHMLMNIKKWDYGDFKGYSKMNVTRGFIMFDNGDVFTIFIEAGRASMVMINGIGTFNQIVGEERQP
jgi:hypothetical protein